ncbi:ATP12 family chaperone protein [Sphingomonas sp. ID0503]|uniref:ATP12 family chaperone protein n=1 Tax=Sphingomonas sp. ID0503 TaxID=3399691 RepID=UPI003AFB48AD
MKRFYKSVEVVDRAIHLDGRPVRTPKRALLALPTDALAEAVAAEWRAQGDEIVPGTMPFTGLSNAAIDIVTPDAPDFVRPLAAYAETDLTCYRAEGPASLVTRQAELWDPPLAWARARYDVTFEVVTGISHRPQPFATVERLAAALAAREAFELAGLYHLITLGGSLVIALMLHEGAIDADAAWTAVQADEDWQAEKWGVDDLAAKAQAARRADFMAAARFLELIR